MSELLGLTHEEQQKAVERIQALTAEGLSMAEAIQVVVKELQQERGAEQ
ncbi:YoaH family protein [Ferrimonas sediminicola]|uniref:YoaH family protein n=1 Tax=Ferrimonas sediminicola TaxID=2569538 RepID=A0A4U1BCC8_9GAMM|nr:YoaH family protein [Ferrimonas sediminicola]TKB48122.1 YoaH family protein [Ferrimonas sediminicola]